MAPTPEAFSRLNLYAVLDSLPIGVTLANSDGRIVFSNHAADRTLGVTAATEATPDEWAAHYGVFLPDGETPFPTDRYPLVRALAGEITKDVEMSVRNAANPDGILISASGEQLVDGDGRGIGAAVVFRDITELRRAQRALEETNRRLLRTQELKNEILSYVVHDLKNPLTTIIAIADLILADDDARAWVEDDIRTIREAAVRVNALVLDLLDIQMAEEGVLEVRASDVRVAELFDTVRREALGRFGSDVERLVVDGPEGVWVRADRSLLLRVLVNLVDNCLKYGPADGRIWIHASAHPRDAVVISVRDEGPGVPPHLRDRIFEKYARMERDQGVRSEDSRGLGLRFCRVVADAHGGRIWVEDATPRGARFCVELPS